MSASAETPAESLVLTAGASIDDREERLANGADELAGKRTAVVGGPNVLLIAAGSAEPDVLTLVVP